MDSRSDKGFSAFTTLVDVLAIPWNFLSGYFLGLLAPVAAIAAVVAGIRFLTGQVPFLEDVSEAEEGRRRLSLGLMPPEQAREAYELHKEQIGGDLVKMKNEIQAIIEEARREAEGAAVLEKEQTEA
jgi:hypothetical protein